MRPKFEMRNLVSFVLMAMWLLGVILDNQKTLPETPTGPSPIVEIDKPSKPTFLAWVATSAARGRMEVLFIEQKSIRDQLTEILQEVEDYTWTPEGLANFSIKITRKGTGLETNYSILPKVRKVPAKIADSWANDKDSIWLPNYFEGKDPFDGRQVDEKGMPAGGVDKRGATVIPTTSAKTVEEDNTEF